MGLYSNISLYKLFMVRGVKPMRPTLIKETPSSIFFEHKKAK